MKDVLDLALFAIGALVPTLLLFTLVRWCFFKMFKQAPVWPCAGLTLCLCIILWSLGSGANTPASDHLLAMIFYTIGVCAWVPFFMRRDRQAALKRRIFTQRRRFNTSRK